MALTFTNFKRTIPSNILARGRQYYNDGAVTDLSQEEEDTWIAEVQGTAIYEVQVALNQDNELLCTCTCPYDYGEHCKHIAAVLYAIEETFPERVEGKVSRAKGPKRRTKLDKLAEALEGTPPEKLRAALLDLAQSQREYGFIDYQGARQAASQLNVLLVQAGRMMDEGLVNRAIALYQAIMEQTIEAYGQADDSSGALGGCIAYAIEGLRAGRRSGQP
jgi:uncharacterized Zn finger protein